MDALGIRLGRVQIALPQDCAVISLRGNGLQRKSVARQKECSNDTIIGTIKLIAPIIVRGLDFETSKLTASFV